jgi:outer membrane receptor protein involved in Fe transport
MDQATEVNYFHRSNSIDDTTLKGNLSYKANNEHLIEFGFETKFNKLAFKNSTDIDMPEERLPSITGHSVTLDFYIQDSWKINPFWTFQPGVRFSNFRTRDISLTNSSDANYFRASPRVSLRRTLSPESNVFVSYGRYYQFLNLISFGISTPFDVWVPIDGDIKPGEADHYILGYKHDIMDGLGLDIELYFKDMRNLVEYNWEMDYEWDNNTSKLKDLFLTGYGDAKGMDILLRTDKFGWSGFLGYTFCITRKKIEGINVCPETSKSQYYFPTYDKTHQLNVVQTFDITERFGWQLWGAEMSLGLTYAYATGQPVRVPEQVYFTGDNFVFLYSYSDRYRLPYYSRLDLGYHLKWYRRHIVIEPYIQAINVLNRTNVFSRNYYLELDEDYNMQLRHSDFGQFPFIPFIGVNVMW